MALSFSAKISAWWKNRNDFDQVKIYPEPEKDWRRIMTTFVAIILGVFIGGWWLEYTVVAPAGVPATSIGDNQASSGLNPKTIESLNAELAQKKARYDYLVETKPLVVDPSQ